ncbi:hypothetical protein GGR54DRAFT_298768 [Hypoxylon sp. NC1633]|nr:hypothetical protein GGR54DRAFT_298768 [Hypoxylon sp. NC1633]
MPRRAHRKSRMGCSECKRRHMKCDEVRPACGNCSITSRPCSFLSSQPNAPMVDGSPASSSLSPASASVPYQSDAIIPSHRSSPASPVIEFPAVQSANMAQLEIFYHCLNTDFGLPAPPNVSKDHIPYPIIVEATLSHPFFMNELLAFGALHLAHLNPMKAQFYRHQAVGLQTNALNTFNAEMTKVTRDNCIAVICFNFLLNLHTLLETKEPADTPGVLDRYVHHMQLHRKAKNSLSDSWQLAMESKLGPILQGASGVLEYIIESGSHTAELKNCVRGSERLNDKEKLGCQEALDRIQWFLSGADGPRENVPSLAAIVVSLISWPLIIDADVIRLVAEKVPEALLIISYFAIPLHLCRNVWIFGTTGRRLAQSVRLHLDAKWHAWLDWPEEMMNTLSPFEGP